MAGAVAAGVIAAGAAPAHAADEAVAGYGYVGGAYWCEPDSAIREADDPEGGWVYIWVTGSDFDGQGQTMQFKVINPWTNLSYGYSGWFAVPSTVGYMPVAPVSHGTTFKICATFGGGPRNTPFRWWGRIDYPG